MGHRWPLHPRPFAGEALSSWLTRIAAVYDFNSKEPLLRDLSVPPLSNQCLDIEPPEQLFDLLEERTGVARQRIRRMTLKGLLPESVSISGPSGFEAYAQSLSIALPSDTVRAKRIPATWTPWWSAGRYLRPWVCPECVADRHIRHMKLAWLLPIMATCPTHNLFLVSSDLIGIIDLRPNKPSPRAVPASLIELDCLTETAIATGQAVFSSQTVDITTWMQILRTLLDELNTPLGATGAAWPLVKVIWRIARCSMRARAQSHLPFEGLKIEQQLQFLEAAAVAFKLIATKEAAGHGTNVGMIGGAASRPASRRDDRAAFSPGRDDPRCTQPPATRLPKPLSAEALIAAVDRVPIHAATPLRK